jgi:hypothetical protein
MPYIVADRVKETTTVTGTGPATLAGAASGYRSFASQLSIGDTCAYVIVNSNASEWETGIGTYSAVNTLTRTTIHASTNANAAVVFTAGTKDVFMGPTANTILSDVTSTDGSVTINQTGTISDLSVAVAPATLNVLVAVRNTTGATLVKGTVVYISGSTGQISTVTKAIADSDANSAQTLGMISADIDDNTNGYVTIIGLIDNVDTKGYSAGTQLYLSPTVAGEFTSTKPYAPNHLVYVGIVERGTVQGKIFVKVQNGYELDELHDVAAQSPNNGQTIVYNSTTELWEKNYPSLTNALSSVPVVSGAGNSLTLTAGSGVGTGAGGSLILQAGIQATTGGDGKVVVKQVAGQTSNLQEWQDSTAGIKAFVDSSGNIGTGLNVYSNRLYIGPTPETYLTGGSQSVGIKIAGNSQLSLYSGSVENIRYYTDQTWVRSNHSIVWSSSFNGATVVCSLLSEATNTLAQRNGTNAQTFRVYNTYTDASNYERLGITWASNVCTIGLAQAGTGLVRSLVIAGANATSGAGGNVTITAGNGSGAGAGGNIILQPGAQGTSGGNGQIRINTSAGVDTGFNFTNTYASYPTLEQARLYIRSGSNSNVIELNASGGSIGIGKTNGQFSIGSSDNANYVGIRENGNAGTLGVICGSSSAGGSLNFISSTTAIAANTNDLALSASAFQRISCTTNPYNLTGIAPVTGTGSAHKDGRMIRIYNVGTANLTLSHNSASSTAANRMFSSTGADIILAPNDYAELIYDATSNGSGAAGWRVS